MVTLPRAVPRARVVPVARQAPRSAIARALAWLLLALLASLSTRPAHAAGVDEVNVHGAYIINFIRYASWPSQDEAGPYVIAVVGEPEVARAPQQLVERAPSVAGRPVSVRAVALAVTPPAPLAAARQLRAALQGAHVVYVAGSHRAWARAAVTAAEDRPMLTVGVGDEFVEAGGMFGLMEDRGRISFIANEDAVRKSPVGMSARVLMLSRPRGR